MKATDVKNIQVPDIPQRCASAIFRAPSVKYLLRALVDKERALLIIAFYARESVCKGEREPEIVLYQSKTDYLTRCNIDGKAVWRTGCLTHIMNSVCERICWNPIDACVFLTKREEKLADAFIGKQNSGDSVLRRLTGLQEQIKSERLTARHDHMMAAIDHRMATVPELPEGFMRWADRTPLKKSRYLFLHRVTRKKWTGICTHCGADVDLVKARHNEEAICPVCGTHATVKTRSKMENTVDVEYASLLQKSLAGEVVLRLFQFTRTFSMDSQKAKISCFEYGRFFYDADGKPAGSYKWKRFKNTVVRRWSGASESDWYPNRGLWMNELHADWDCPLYPWGISKALSGTPLQYFAKTLIRDDIREKHTTLARDNIMYSLRYPFVELFRKLGADKLYLDFQKDSVTRRRFDELKGRNLKDIFGLTRYHIQQMLRLDMGIDEFSYLVDTHSMQLSDDDFRWAYGNLNSKLFMLLRKYASMNKIRKYTESHPEHHIYWRDYVNNCVTLGYDLKNEYILFPRNLKTRHDAVMKLVKIRHKKLLDAKIAERYAQLKDQYAYSDGRYLLIPPQNLDDMMKEGADLHHCVGTNYSELHANGGCDIFFVRKIEDPDKPFATVELRDGRIQQCYGFSHAQMPQIKGFLDNWMQEKVFQPLTLKSIAA